MCDIVKMLMELQVLSCKINIPSMLLPLIFIRRHLKGPCYKGFTYTNGEKSINAVLLEKQVFKINI